MSKYKARVTYQFTEVVSLTAETESEAIAEIKNFPRGAVFLVDSAIDAEIAGATLVDEKDHLVRTFNHILN